MAYRISAAATGVAQSDTVTVTDPGSVAGDQLCLFVFAGGNTARTLSSIPSGFTTIATAAVHGATHGIDDGTALFLAGTTRAGSYSVTVAGGNLTTPVVILVCNSGRNIGSSPSNFTTTNDPSANGGASPVSVALSGVTALANDDLLVLNCVNASPATAYVFTPASGTTSRQTQGAGQPANNDQGTINLCTQDAVSAGATGTLTSIATSAGSNADFCGFVVSLPATGGGAVLNFVRRKGGRHWP